MVCEVDVLPFPQRNAIGVIPSEAEAVHATFVADGTPTHEVVNAEAALAKANNSTKAALAIETATFLLKIILYNIAYPFNVESLYHDS